MHKNSTLCTKIVQLNLNATRSQNISLHKGQQKLNDNLYPKIKRVKKVKRKVKRKLKSINLYLRNKRL